VRMDKATCHNTPHLHRQIRRNQLDSHRANAGEMNNNCTPITYIVIHGNRWTMVHSNDRLQASIGKLRDRMKTGADVWICHFLLFVNGEEGTVRVCVGSNARARACVCVTGWVQMYYQDCEPVCVCVCVRGDA
jgi:hypothetical protein